MKDEWFIHVDDEEKRLFVSREKLNPSGAFSPCNMTADDVDYEMSKGKNKKILEICGMEQKSFEYFVEKWGYNIFLLVNKKYILFFLYLLNFLLSLGRLTKISGCSISVPVVCYTLTATAIAVAASSLLTEPVLKVPSFLLIAAALMFLMKVIKKEDLLWLKGLIQTSKSKNAAL